MSSSYSVNAQDANISLRGAIIPVYRQFTEYGCNYEVYGQYERVNGYATNIDITYKSNTGGCWISYFGLTPSGKNVKVEFNYYGSIHDYSENVFYV